MHFKKISYLIRNRNAFAYKNVGGLIYNLKICLGEFGVVLCFVCTISMYLDWIGEDVVTTHRNGALCVPRTLTRCVPPFYPRSRPGTMLQYDKAGSSDVDAVL
ncbi:hypothetical protein CC78DRAFT_77069 [Lojkania enalia]|uniref:Uncharacterized protein n=1 Tax=Lojkania enalia TaxID=147567 RepID=A0A9P4KDX3_9PLEO|nr:hypothetical protein CC78DRAFT_77069 [Didymosphaeria enalia]